MKNKQKGMSLLQLVIITAITGILIMYSISSYNDYIIRAKLVSKLAGVGSLKLAAAENIIAKQNVNNSDILVIDTDDIVKDSKLLLKPIIANDMVLWSCGGIGLTNAQRPSGCGNAYNLDNNDTPIVQEKECIISEGIIIDGEKLTIFKKNENGDIIAGKSFTSLNKAINNFRKEFKGDF